jgi:hypothetical protein
MRSQRDVIDAILKVDGIAAVVDQKQRGEQIGHGSVREKQQQPWRMPAAPQMIGEMTGHRLVIEGEDDSPLAFGPEKQVWIGYAEGQVKRITHTDDIERKLTRSLVLLNRLPESAPPQMFVQHKA